MTSPISRPSVAPRGRDRHGVAVGVDIGGTKVLGALVDETGRPREHRVPSPTSWPEMRDAIVGVISAAADAAPRGRRRRGRRRRAWSTSTASSTTRRTCPASARAPVRADVAAATGLPTIVDNDANTAAYAEIKLGVAGACTTRSVITLGTGIGGGVHRRRAGAAGRPRLRGRDRPLPDRPGRADVRVRRARALGGDGVRQRARARWRETPRPRATLPSVLEPSTATSTRSTGTHVSAAAHAGAPDALALVDQYSFNVAIGLVGLANIFDPALIAIAGGLVNDGDLFLAPIAPHFLGHIEGAEYRAIPRDRAGAAGERAGVIGRRDRSMRSRWR